MKKRNINLENTPLLTNNICKCITLEAPTLSEIKKKVKEYEMLLVRVLTNAYKLSSLSMDNDETYALLPNGNYETSIYLNFSGIKKEEVSNPEKTLQYVKHLTTMESKKQNITTQKEIHVQQNKDHHTSIIIPIEIKTEDTISDVISNKQRQLLEQLITDTNLIKVSFFIESKKRNPDTNCTTISLKVDYDYREILEIAEEHSAHYELEDI